MRISAENATWSDGEREKDDGNPASRSENLLEGAFRYTMFN